MQELEAAAVVSAESLTKEKATSSTLRTRTNQLSTQLEVLKSQASNTAQDVSSATAQVGELSRKLGEATDEIARLGSELFSATASLADLTAALARSRTEADDRVEAATTAAAAAEFKWAEDARAKQELASQLAATDAKLLELETSHLRLLADTDGMQARERALQSELSAVQVALCDVRADRDAQMYAADQARAETQDMRERLVVAEEERDAARDKEEEYFREIEDREEQISRIQEGYVDISDRLNDKMDEIGEYRSELEDAKEAALHWQQKAMQASAPRGSGLDAVPARRAELACRAVLCKLYTKMGALQSAQAAAPRSGPSASKAAKTPADDDYEDDFDEADTASGRPSPAMEAMPVITPADFECLELLELSAVMEACLDVLVQNVKPPKPA